MIRDEIEWIRDDLGLIRNEFGWNESLMFSCFHIKGIGRDREIEV